VRVNEMSVYYDCATGGMIGYEHVGECLDRNYSSPVRPDSSEQEYIKYAKQIILDFSGKSVEGCHVSIRTRHGEVKYGNYHNNWRPGFESFPEEREVIEENACYEISFWADICGIPSNEKIVVKMTNVGEIMGIDAAANLDRYDLYKDAVVDVELLETTVMDNAPGKYGATRYMTTVLHAQEDALWAECDVINRWESQGVQLSGGNQYFVKLARRVPVE